MMDLLALLYFMLPAYIANMAPVLTKGILKKLAYPVDFGAKFRGKPLLGKNKTWRGLIMGVMAGALVFLAQRWLYQFQFFARHSLIDYSSAAVWIGVLLGFGALAGDMVESFFKRQTSRKPGKPWIPFDQVDYTIGALLFVSIMYFPGWVQSLVLVLASVLLHIGANHFAYYTGIRKEKW
jgi:CDP-2,3-bis-(O-geranylgeranyl)-sn-glycerol synthase